MIITVDEVNQILNLSGRDDQIGAIIPPAEGFAIDYCKNFFHIKNQCVSGYDISFSSSDKKIINPSGSFINDQNKFVAGLHIHVKNSIYNDGFFSISSVSSEELIAGDNDNIIDEDSGALINIYLVKIPEGFKLSLINYVGYLLRGLSKDLQSESIGDYSYSLKPEENILSNYFKAYRKIGVI